MSALIRAKLTPQVADQAMTNGHRYDGTTAWKAAIADIATPKDDVQTTALKKVQPLVAKPGTILGVIKSGMYADVLSALVDDDTNDTGR